MTADEVDEELRQPPRRVPPVVVMATLAGLAVVATLLLTVDRGDGPAPTTSAPPSPSPALTLEPATVPIAAPAALLRAVTATYPAAELIEVGVAAPLRAESDRNYQFLAGPRRITVAVGRADARPEVQTASARDVLIVAKRSGHRVAVSVRAVRGALGAADLTTARRLAEDTRLLATS